MTDRFTVSLEPALAAEFSAYLERQGYGNRSEAVRDLIRDALTRERLEKSPESGCIGVLSYLYDHHERELSKRLTATHHEHHSLTVTTLHMHVDHATCVEAALLRGSATDVLSFGESVMARPGIQHGRLHRIPLTGSPATAPHERDDG